MKVNKKLATIIMVCVISFSMFGCSDTERTSNTDTERVVRINQSPTYVSATSIVMQKKGILEKYLPDDVKVEWSDIHSGPDIRDAVVSGNCDIADFSLMTYLTSRENDLPITLMSFSGSTDIKIYSTSDSIKGLSDFGERDSISITNKNTNLHVAFLALCKEELGDYLKLDNNLTAIPAADAIAAIETSDDYKGAVFSFPMSCKAEKVGKLLMLNDMSEIVKEYGIGDVVVARDDYYEENPDIIDAFLAAQEETIDYINSNPEEAATILSEYYEIEQKDVLDALKNMPPTNKIVGYDKQAQLLFDAGILTKQPTKFDDLENYEKIVK